MSISKMFFASGSQVAKYFHILAAGITTVQLHSTKAKLRFCTGLNPACGVLEIRNNEDFWQWSQLEIRVNAFGWSTIAQKQFIIIIIIIIIIVIFISFTE